MIQIGVTTCFWFQENTLNELIQVSLLSLSYISLNCRPLMRKLSLILAIFICSTIHLIAQDSYHITFVSDGADGTTKLFEQLVKNEILALLSSKYSLSFNTIYAEDNSADKIKRSIDEAYSAETDLIIGLGLRVCDQLAKRRNHPKPTILSFVLDNELQQIPMTPEGTSGVPNLTYTQSPFDITRDLKTLFEIVPFEELAIISTESLDGVEFKAFFDKALDFTNATYTEIPVIGNADNILSKISQETDAVYILPLYEDDLSAQETRKLLEALARRGIPAFSLLSQPMLDLGVYAAYETDGNLQRVQRRIAINAMKIADGQAPEDLSVTMDHFEENLIINIKTVKKSGLYPNWETLAKGVLVNVTEVDQPEHSLTLQSAIAEGLQNNLGIKIADKGVQIVEKDVAIARSNYLPQIDASASVLTVDENTIQTSFGTKGFFNASASATLSQLILSEPAMANIAIQKMLLESERQVKRQNEMDVILDVANAYLGILQTLELVKLRNENVTVTRKNYDISQAKEQVGYGGTSDVYRWQSELALDNVDLNTTQAQLQQARFGLNALLNRPIKEEFQLGDVNLSDSILLVMDSRLFPLINNPGDIEIFADFLVEEAFRNLPEIKQIEASMAAQERSFLSQQRAFYLPTVALSAQYDYPIDNSGYPEGVVPFDVKPTYNAAVSLQLPIFQGNSRRREKEQTQIGVFQLQDQLANLRNNLELQVRSNMETAGASFSNLELSQEAAEAARKNFEIAQNSYQQGILNITSLIDAQNAYLSAKINATNAAYTFTSDFLAVERSIGYYHFLALPQEQDAFFQRFIEFITKK